MFQRPLFSQLLSLRCFSCWSSNKKLLLLLIPELESRQNSSRPRWDNWRYETETRPRLRAKSRDEAWKCQDFWNQTFTKCHNFFCTFWWNFEHFAIDPRFFYPLYLLLINNFFCFSIDIKKLIAQRYNFLIWKKTVELL